MSDKPKAELVHWVQHASTLFGLVATSGYTPAIQALGTDPENWDQEIDNSDRLDHTKCYSLITFKGAYPTKIRHIYRCWRCGKYERPWQKPSRCGCWLKYDPEAREMRFSEPCPEDQG